MSQSAVAVSIGGAAMPESATGGGSSELGIGDSTKQPPPEALQDGDTNNSLEPGEVVTPPHHRHSSSPALKKQMLLGKTLRKTLNSHNHNHIEAADGCEEQVRALIELARKENGSLAPPADEADDSEGLYSDTDSSVEDLRSVQDVQQARKEKQAEAAAAAALPQAPPTPFLGMSPLRFHMRAPPPCFDFPRMGFMPRMARGGPRGMRPPFFGRPPAPNRLGGHPPPSPGAQLPPGGGGGQGSGGNNPGRGKQPQSELIWTSLQPAVSYTFNLVSECANSKHKDCQHRAESAPALKSKEPAGDEKEKKTVDPSDPLREKTREGSQQKVAARGKTKEKDQIRGKTRDRSLDRNSTRGSPEQTREKSKNRELTRGKTRERSKEKDSNRGRTRGSSQLRNQTRGKSRERKTRERSRARDPVRGKTREKSKERDQTRAKTTAEKPRELDQTRGKAREVSPERAHTRGKTRERSKERDHTRAKTKDRSRSKDKSKEQKQKLRAISKEKTNDPLGEKSKDKPKGSLDKFEKSIDKSRDKRHSEKSKENYRERSRERSRRSSKEKLQEKSAERAQEMEAKSRNYQEISMEPSKDRLDRRRERSKDKQERSREKYSKEKSREHSREKPRCSKNDKSRDHSGEKQLGTPRERRSRRANTPHDSFRETSQTKSKSEASSAWEGKEGTPPMTPPQQRPQTPPASDTPKTKAYDIFADSPPRSNTAVAAVPAVTIERSTTPPLKTAPVSTMLSKPTKLTPLLKASEIHIRIGALLEDDDNDLHLEALLANKEQLFRRTNEYKERKEAPREIKAERELDQPRYVNPFNRESVLSSERISSRSPSSKKRSLQRNGNRRSRDSEENWDSDAQQESESFKEISIKIEKDLTPPPPQRTFTAARIKVERNATPPRVEADRDREVLVRNGAVAANAPPPPAKEQESPDTDDYLDNWENDDSISSMPKNAAPATPSPAPAPAANRNASLNVKPLPPPPAQFNDDDEDEDADEDDSNALWNANSTPPPRARVSNPPKSNIDELYDKFMNSIEMSNETAREEETSKNSSLSNSTAEDSSSGSDTSSSSSSSSDSDEDSSSDDDNSSGDDESSPAAGASKSNQDDQPGKEHQQKKNNVSKDLRKLKSLEDNLARIQMMRENYDAGDEISEELLKMESLFLMQRNAIMDKYRKQELKSNSSEDQQQQQQIEAPQVEPPPHHPDQQGSSSTPINSIFDANRGAIKMTISRLKLTSKSAIFDKDEADQQPAGPSKLPAEPPKLSLPLPPVKPHKEVAIVKPTIVESRSKPRVLRSPPPPAAGNRRRSRSRSISRNRSRRRSLRPKSRSPSPRRWRPPSPRRGSRFGKRNSGGSATGPIKMGRSRSRSISRSRTRSRSPNRRRRPPVIAGSRRRGSLSPGPTKAAGPRSPPHPRLRRSLSRERERERDRRSRSPLPFKPPSPPMRRSWSHSRSPTRRRTRSRSRSRSPRFRSPIDGGQSFADYFEENQGMEAAAYYYNMSLMQQEDQDPTGEGYDTYAAYIDSAYNMEQAYAQYTEGYSHIYGEYPGEMVDSSASPQLMGSVLRELPMAPVVPVAVQKGNVLEIVPTSETMAMVPDVNLVPVPIEEPIEDESKPKRKRVNFVDNVLPNYESENEDRAVVTIAVERALRQYQERRSRAAARLQQIRDELLALPPPPPPLTPKPANLEKPVLVQKKPKFRYFHFDPLKGAIVKTHSRVLRPNIRPPFDPKHFAMLMKTGRLPPFPPGFMRHRPPNIPAHVDPATKAAMLKEFFSKHPPPPLPMPMSMPMPDGMPYYLSGPPPMAAGASLSPVPQPIPVLGSHGYPGYAQPPAGLMIPSPVPVPVPVPPVAVPPLAVSVPVSTASTPPPAMIAPFFTPPPLPELLPLLPDLPSQFTVNSVPTITEIMPVDILQQLGPLPKTLDVDDGGGTASPEMASNDLKEAGDEPEADQQPVVEAQPQLLVETQ